MNFNKTSDPIEYGDVHKLLGDLLRRARKDKGLSGTQTAKLFNISQ